MLNFEPGKLEQLQLENDESIVTFIIKEWFKIPMTFTERWEQLDKTIFDLEREECALSKELHSSPQGSSDSAFSELDTFPSSSVSSGELALEEEGAQSYSLVSPVASCVYPMCIIVYPTAIYGCLQKWKYWGNSMLPTRRNH